MPRAPTIRFPPTVMGLKLCPYVRWRQPVWTPSSNISRCRGSRRWACRTSAPASRSWPRCARTGAPPSENSEKLRKLLNLTRACCSEHQRMIGCTRWCPESNRSCGEICVRARRALCAERARLPCGGAIRARQRGDRPAAVEGLRGEGGGVLGKLMTESEKVTKS